MRSRLRVGAVATVSALSMLFAGTAAWAGIKGSASGYFSENGVNYRTVSVVHTNASGSARAFAETDLIPRNTSVAAGRIQANARLFNSSGTLVRESGFKSNTSTIGAGGVWDVFTSTHTTSGSYKSWGVVKAWNGSSYAAHYAHETGLLATGTP